MRNYRRALAGLVATATSVSVLTTVPATAAPAPPAAPASASSAAAGPATSAAPALGRQQRREASRRMAARAAALKAPKDVKPITTPTLDSNPGADAPGVARATPGRWTVYSPAPAPRSRSEIDVPGDGTPLWGDWDGNGVPTPGRYAAGQWFTSNERIELALLTPSVTYGGGPTDVPIVGDWNGDKVDEVGVFRDGAFYLRGSTGKTTLVRFGTAGDVPVIGDWNGDGTDDLGVVRAGTWYLQFPKGADRPVGIAKKKFVTIKKTGLSTLTIGYGGVSDRPVVGDWDGDGVSTPGVVRDNKTWLLARSFATLATPYQAEYVLDPALGDVPVAVPMRMSPDSCPTTAPNAEQRAFELARTVRPPIPLAADEAEPQWSDLVAAGRDGGRWAIVNDLTSRLASARTAGYYDVLSQTRIQEFTVRRSANAAAAVALILGTAPWNQGTGVRLNVAERYVRWQVRSIACQHVSVTAGGWGNGWQTALWAAVTGQAAWSIWDRLTPQEQAYVASMVAAEADYVVARGPRYYRNRDGVELTPGNSRSDEVSWDLLAPALAAAMMPKDTRAQAWRASLVHHAMAAFARPSDLASGLVLNGINVSAALGGSNANDDFTVANHGLPVTPDYIQNVQHLWWAMSLLRAGGQPVPEMLMFNAESVYGVFTGLSFSAPPYLGPGGTIYRPDGSVYYPAGVDWGTRRPATFAGVDAFATLYASSGGSARNWLALHAGDVRAMQARFGDGRIYADDVEESYRGGKEEYASHQLALGWWAFTSAYTAPLKIDRSAYPPPGA